MGRPGLQSREISEPELVRWGERVGETLQPPLWICLYGPLGAGKSVLARAIIRGAGVSGHVPSPSFTLVQSYRSARGFTVHHVDLYRLEPGDSLEPLGWEDLLRSDDVVLVEWANRAGAQLPSSRWEIRLDHTGRPGTRSIGVESVGEAPELVDW